MAIQPIDLQTLYTQMEKIGKQQGAEQQQAAVNRETNQLTNKLEAEKNLSSVRQSQAVNNENLAVNKDGRNTDEKKPPQQKKKTEGKKENQEEESENYITDPLLGRKIDISG